MNVAVSCPVEDNLSAQISTVCAILEVSFMVVLPCFVVRAKSAKPETRNATAESGVQTPFKTSV